VLAGLEATPKAIPSEWLVDDAGADRSAVPSDAGDRDATRFEALIVERCAGAIASAVGRGACVVAWGCAAGGVTERLLAALDAPRLHVPVDSSALALAAATQHLRRHFPALPIRPIADDFMRLSALPMPVDASAAEGRTLVVMPAQRIGALPPDDTAALLQRIRRHVDARTVLVVGTPLSPHPSLPIDVMAGAAGIGAGLGRRLMSRINRELGGDFDPAVWRQAIRFDAARRRIDRALVCLEARRVRVLGRLFDVGAGESIRIDRTHVHGLERFETLARAAGWHVCQRWTDGAAHCAVHVLMPGAGD